MKSKLKKLVSFLKKTKINRPLNFQMMDLLSLQKILLSLKKKKRIQVHSYRLIVLINSWHIIL